ncbi:MAG: DNA photolyase family protein [Gammaproteobacteria bacterium]|nr:DNA photolyase family protein [Gammaproteobacteria bacterium]
MQPVLLWFRRNLRLSDNSALLEAVASGRPLIPVYVVDEQDAGSASRWWLHHSLSSLDSDLRERGSALRVFRGSPPEVLAGICTETGARALYYARRYEPVSRKQEQDLEALLGERIAIHAVDDGLLHHPETVKTQSGSPYRVFTPFWKAAAALGEPGMPVPAPAAASFAEPTAGSMSVDDLALLSLEDDRARQFHDAWTPGETGGLQRIDAAESILSGYAAARDRPDLDATSRLSPHLHFGEISVRQVWHAIRQYELSALATSGGEALLRQLHWRDFSSYLLFHFPELPEKPLRSEFEHFPWSTDEDLLEAWKQGMTGYPIVDAGMRQLWQTGWMHNRVRMIAASFLVKDLMVPWQAGAEWFLDTLVDADLANNSASWQWVAGCGSDAAPYFRIFNPTLQEKKFDPNGRYVRRWVPDAGGATYPEPIVDHGQARQAALAAYQSVKGMRTSNVAP